MRGAANAWQLALMPPALRLALDDCRRQRPLSRGRIFGAGAHLCERQNEAKLCPTTGPVFGPYFTPVHLNDRPRDRQTKPGAVPLGRVKSFKNLIEPIRRDADAVISNRNLDRKPLHQGSVDRNLLSRAGA